MARPKNTDSETTRLKILETAARLFSRRGLHAVGMREIAAESGVTQPAVHHYFGTKDELHGAVLEAMYLELAKAGEKIQSAVLAAGSAHAAVDLGVRALYQFALAHRDEVVLAMRESLDSSRKVRSARAQLLGGLLLDQGAEALSALTGRPTSKLRLSLLSLNFLMSRFVCLSPQEKKLLVAPAANGAVSPAQLDQLIEGHLVESAFQMLLGVSQP